MKKVYNKKVNNKKKQPMSQADRNKIYAYLLLAAFAIWTICSVLGSIAFFRTQRSAGMETITANAEETLTVSDTVMPTTRLFDLANSAKWEISGSDVQSMKEITNFYTSDGLVDFSYLYTSLFSSDLDITQDYGYNFVYLTFDYDDHISIADLLFNIAVNASVAVPTQVLKRLYVSYSDGQGWVHSYSLTRSFGEFTYFHPEPYNFLFNPYLYITSISFQFYTTDYFHQSSMILYPFVSGGSYDAGYQIGYHEGFDAGTIEGNQFGYEHGYNDGYIAGYDEGESAGQGAGYDEGYTDGYDEGMRDYQEEIALLKNGVFGLSYQNVANMLDGNTQRSFFPVVLVGGIFDVSKTFRNTFTDYNSSSFENGAISFSFIFNVNEIKLSELSLNFTLNTSYLSSLDLFDNFGICRVYLSDGSYYDCPAVWDEIVDNTSMGHYDFSSVPAFNGRYLSRLDFNFYSTVFFKNYAYTIVDVNGYYGIGYDAGYELGYSAGVGSLREQLLKEYKSGYQQGEEVGYNKGYDEGATAAHSFTFDRLLSSVIDTPIKAFTSLFNFEILGVNLANFFFGLLTVMLVLAIIKLIL